MMRIMTPMSENTAAEAERLRELAEKHRQVERTATASVKLFLGWIEVKRKEANEAHWKAIETDKQADVIEKEVVNV